MKMRRLILESLLCFFILRVSLRIFIGKMGLVFYTTHQGSDLYQIQIQSGSKIAIMN